MLDLISVRRHGLDLAVVVGVGSQGGQCLGKFLLVVHQHGVIRLAVYVEHRRRARRPLSPSCIMIVVEHDMSASSGIRSNHRRCLYLLRRRDGDRTHDADFTWCADKRGREAVDEAVGAE